MSDALSTSLPPSDEGAERAVIGAILLDPGSFAQVGDIIKPTDFWSSHYREAFRAIGDLASGGAADPVTVLTRLKDERRPWHRDVDWDRVLAECAAAVPSAAGIVDYARIVRDKAIHRQLRQEARRLLEDAPGADLTAFVDRFITGLLEAAGHLARHQTRHIRAVAHEFLDSLGSRPPTLRTGLTALDRLIGGFAEGDLVVVAGRPGMGKSTLAQNFSEHIATHHGPVLVFSLEMPGRALLCRMICGRTGVSLQQLRHGNVPPEQYDAVVEAMQGICELPLHINDGFDLKHGEVLAHALRLQQTQALALIVVDYLGLMHAPKAERREQEIARLSRSLKAIAGRLNLPVVAVTQLNRDLEKRKDKRPRLADLRESGALEQDADLVLMVHRPHVYDTKAPEDEAWIHVAKQRNGPTGRVRVRFNGAQFRFADAQEDEG